MVSILSVLLLVILFNVKISYAADVNLVYINGIQNTLEMAAETANTIAYSLKTSANHYGRMKTFNVENVWNPIGWSGNKDGWDLSQDKMELFLLKTAEEKYRSDFQKIIVPFNMSQTIDQDAATRVNAYLDDMTPWNNYLESEGKITDADMNETQRAAKSLVSSVERLGSAVVVAHSQGNLLANLAYARLAKNYGNDTTKMIRVVNVANVSEFSVNSLNFTHRGDAALFSGATESGCLDNSLETIPSRGNNWTRTTDKCAGGTEKFTIAAATFDYPTTPIPDQDFFDKCLNHSIVQTYLSTAIVPVLDDQGITFTTSAERFVDRFEDFIYAAAESLYLSKDTDRDGVADSIDQCPSTPQGEIVNANGCSISQLVVDTLKPAVNEQISYQNEYTFTWKPLNLPNESTLKYFVSIQKDANPDEIYFNDYADGNDKQLPMGGFLPGAKYFWHVWAVDQNGVWSKALAAGNWPYFTTSTPPIVEYSGMTQNFNNTNYGIAFGISGANVSSIDVLNGPNILSTFQNHANLSRKPVVGDTYTIRINYKDGTSQESTYTVEGVNDNVAAIISPQDNSIIESTQPTIRWQQAAGTVSRYMIIIQKIEGTTERFIWSSYLGETTTSCVFNFDNTASEALQPGGKYRLYLHSYDENWNSASSIRTFSIASPIPSGVHAEYQASHSWNYITWTAVPGALTYKLYWGTEPAVTKNSEYGGETPKTEFSHTGVISGWTYYYRISSVDAQGHESELSEQVSASVGCGAYVAPGVWKEFDCYNLAAIGKTTNDDPFTPSWRLNGGYWQWGRKGPDPSQWYNTNTPNFAHGPTGPDAGSANSGAMYGWSQTKAPNGSWLDASKTANDPCPAGYRVPTISQWQGVIENNDIHGTLGTWSIANTNYSSARFFGNGLMLPAAGFREEFRAYSGSHYGLLQNRGERGLYWSTMGFASYKAQYLALHSSGANPGGDYRSHGLSVRCIAE